MTEHLKPQNNTLSKQLSKFFIGAVLCIIIPICVLSYWILYTNTILVQRTTLSTQSNNIATFTNSKIETMDYLISSVTEYGAFQDYLTTKNSVALTQYLQSFMSTFESISYLDNNNREVFRFDKLGTQYPNNDLSSAPLINLAMSKPNQPVHRVIETIDGP